MNASFYLVSRTQNIPMPRVLALPVGMTFDRVGNLWVVDARSSWLDVGLIGRVVGYDAQVHTLDTREGRVYFQNQAGLLASLSVIAGYDVGLMSYPYGLFNFTIQGLAPHGSVRVTVTFPETLPSNIGWWNIVRGNPLGRGGLEFDQLPANQTLVEGDNMTLTLTNTTAYGVISVVGGPAVQPFASSSVSSIVSINTTNSLQPQINPPASLVLVLLAIVVVTVAFALYRKRRVKHDRL